MSDNDAQTLPEGWLWTTIGEVAATTSGGTPSRKHQEYYTNGTVPWVKSGELRDGIVTNTEEHITEEALQNSSAKIFPKGTPLVALYGATVGKTAILRIDAATNQAVCAIFPQEEAFTAKFITYWLRLQRPNLIDISTGGAQPNISQRIIRSYPFPLAPLPEQHHIVEVIETQFTRLDAAVAALKRAKANLARYKASVLKAACEGRLVPTEAELHPDDYEPADVLLERILVERRARWEAEQWAKEITRARKKAAQTARKANGLPARIRDLADVEWVDLEEAAYAKYLPKNDKWKLKYKASEGPDTSELPELPTGWCWTTVEQLVDVGTGATPLRSKKARYYENGTVPWVTSGALNDLFIPRATEFITDLALQETNAKLFPAGSLLVAMYGEGKTRGKVSELRLDAATNQACAALLFDGQVQNCKLFVKIFFRKNYDDIRRLSSGGVQPNLNLSIIRETRIPLPPLAEQHRIVEEVERRLSVVAEVEASIDANLVRAARLRQSILKRAFEGRLVPQNPDDEPASVLLERIREERDASKSGSKRRSKGRKQQHPQQLELL